MKAKYLFIITVLIIASSLSYARKPAVEDFVGVEHENYQVTPKGAEVLFNFNENISSQNQNSTSTFFTFFFLGAFISLPFLMWAGLAKQKHQRVPTKSIVRVTRYESNHSDHSNVEYLDHYKDNKKAS